jgi:hypothetical protein
VLLDVEPLLVACLCAQWCSVCRQWRAGFDTLAAQLPAAQLLWVDVEDASDLLGDYEPDNFPVLAVQRGGNLLYCASVPQQVALWRRLIDELAALDAAAAQEQAARLAAQGVCLPDLRRLF